MDRCLFTCCVGLHRLHRVSVTTWSVKPMAWEAYRARNTPAAVAVDTDKSTEPILARLQRGEP